jgi:phosphohistidine phosphatase
VSATRPTTRTLVLLRHAKAASPDDYATDIERPLTARGRSDASAAGRWLRDEGLAPDLVLCSPSVRTRETWESAGLPDVPVSYERQLYTSGTREATGLIRATAEDVRVLLVVGHNPTMSTLSALLDATDASGAELRTAGIAVHQVDGDWPACGPGTAPVVRRYAARG